MSKTYVRSETQKPFITLHLNHDDLAYLVNLTSCDLARLKPLKESAIVILRRAYRVHGKLMDVQGGKLHE